MSKSKLFVKHSIEIRDDIKNWPDWMKKETQFETKQGNVKEANLQNVSSEKVIKEDIQDD